MPPVKLYKMSFSTGGLLLNESLDLARLHKYGEPWLNTVKRAMEGGVSTLPKAKSNHRTLYEISNRLSFLSERELNYLIEDADKPEQQALLWLAICRGYRFIGEFSVEVLHQRILAYRPELPLEAFDAFLDQKALDFEELSSIKSSTRMRLRQVLFKTMREAAIIDAHNTIQKNWLSDRVRRVIGSSNPQDLIFFPGLQA